jgi:hypothetical protein
MTTHTRGLTRLVRHMLIAAVAIAVLQVGVTPAMGSDVTGIDLTLPVGTSMSGQVFDSNGDPAAGVTIGVCLDEFSCWPAAADTTGDGSYTVVGIIPGTYIVMAQGFDPETLPT